MVQEIGARGGGVPLEGLAGLPDVAVRRADEPIEGCDLAVLAGRDVDEALAAVGSLGELVRFVRRGGFVLALGAAYPLLGIEVNDQRSGRVIPALKLVSFKATVGPGCRETACQARAQELFAGTFTLRALAFGAVRLRPPARPWFSIEEDRNRRWPVGVVSGDGRVLGAPFVDLLAHRALAEGVVRHVRRAGSEGRRKKEVLR